MRTSTLKSEQVKNYLLEGIRNGKYQNGTCIPSDNQLTAITGMSRTTVRDAVSQLVSAGYMERIQGKGTFVLNTEPDRKTSDTMSLFVSDIMTAFHGNPFIEEILFGVHHSLMQEGIGVKLTSFAANESCQDKMENGQIPDSWLGGVILTAGYSSKKNIDFLKKHNVPCVSIGRPLCSADIPFVDADHFAGGYAAAEHLIDLGHRQIAIFDSFCESSHYLSAGDRKQGINKAFEDMQIPEQNTRLFQCLENDEKKILETVRDFFDSDFKATGVIIYGHAFYRHFVEEAEKRKINIPEDLSLIYCMGYQKLYEKFGLFTTSVMQPLREMGHAAAEMLLHGSENGTSRIFRPQLSPGATTRNLKFNK